MNKRAALYLRVSTTGQTVEKIREDTDRDFILTAVEAKAYGVIDEVVTRRQLAVIEANVSA